jgi:probable rRNA maturation factor
MQKAVGRAGSESWRELSVVLMEDEGTAEVNAAYLGHPWPTDVLSFRLEPVPGDPPGLTGEIIVNVQRAEEVAARRNGLSASRELALYIAHACDHLAGEDDADAAGRRRMRDRERRWLRQAGSAGLIEGIVCTAKH